MDYTKIGDLISSLRKEKNYTQKQLADKLNITDRAVSKWERGKGCPDISLLEKLSSLLDVSVIELLKGRKLDKDEINSNKNLIESLTFSERNIKFKIKKVLDKIMFFIIIVIMLVTLVNIVNNIVYISILYNDINYNLNGNIIERYKNNVKVIKSNSGIYNEDEYKIILKYIEAVDYSFETNKYEMYINKKSYTYKELLELRKIIFNFNETAYVNFVYEVILKYDYNLLKDFNTYKNMEQSSYNFDEHINNILQKPYYIKSSPYIDELNKQDSVNFSYYIEMKYKMANIVLENIIKAGNIYE